MRSHIVVIIAVLLGLCLEVSQAQTKNETSSWIECEGTYGGHLQGIASDGKSIYWSHTVQLVKTDLEGNLQIKIDVPTHHGDLTIHKGKIFVAVELAEFNRPPGASDPWVYVYRAETLKLLRTHQIPELVHGAGGIAYHEGKFIVIGGLPANHEQNYAFEYDDQFNFVKRHVLFSGQTHLGIQTAHFMDNHWWFGCYGSPDNPGLLKADIHFRLVGQSPINYSYGIDKLDNNTVIRGDCFANNRRGKIELVRNQLPPVQAVASRIRLAAYNVLFGIWAEPEAIGKMFKPYYLDVIGFSEVPDGDWTKRVGKVLGMDYAYVGKISSANHDDKFKSILSRTPLRQSHEIEIKSDGWSPASLVGAETTIRGTPLLVYSTHIPGRPEAEGSAVEVIAKSVIPSAQKRSENMVILGDLNNRPGEEPLKRIESTGMRSMWADLKLDTSRLSTHQHIESGRESGVIDHIYYSETSKAKAIQGGIIYNAYNHPDADKTTSRYKSDWEAYGKPLSDHRPIWAELEFPIK
jgi:endonuclease/exonuclease/phosphatase family metal-dependent hydrolase